MSFDTPRSTGIPHSDKVGVRRDTRGRDRTYQARIRLAALAADLEARDVATRLVDSNVRPSDYPVVLRCWNPHRMTFATEVTCVPGAGVDAGTWWFQYLPSGKPIADATGCLSPGTAAVAADRVCHDVQVRM